MVMPRTENPSGNGLRSRKHVAKKSAAHARAAAGMSREQVGEALSEAMKLMASAGLPSPTHEELRTCDPSERARTVSRLIGAAGKAVDLARKRGELMPVEDARRKMAAMAAAVRRALDLAPALLPSSLSPHEREVCAAAMATATASAMATIDATDIRRLL
jgi:hypothetical protein